MSELLNFEVRSSSGSETYNIEFIADHGTISMRCTCIAGQRKTLCKHRVALLSGDVSMLISGQWQAPSVISFITGTRVEKLLFELKELEKMSAEIASTIAGTKRALAAALE